MKLDLLLLFILYRMVKVVMHKHAWDKPISSLHQARIGWQLWKWETFASLILVANGHFFSLVELAIWLKNLMIFPSTRHPYMIIFFAMLLIIYIVILYKILNLLCLNMSKYSSGYSTHLCERSMVQETPWASVWVLAHCPWWWHWRDNRNKELATLPHKVCDPGQVSSLTSPIYEYNLLLLFIFVYNFISKGIIPVIWYTWLINICLWIG